MAVSWGCRCGHSGGGGQAGKNCRLFPGSRKAVSARLRPACSCCPKSAWRPRPDAAPWCDGFWSVVWATPMRSSTGCMRNCGNWAGWGANTTVVIVGDGAEWIWNRATWFIRRCEVLDFWHALEHAWEFARLRYGEGSSQADQWVHQIACDLKDGKAQEVIARLKRLRPKSPQVRDSLDSLIRYYSENAGRMRYDEYLRLGYGIGSGAVESAHKQVVHARLRQAGMRWSEAGA